MALRKISPKKSAAKEAHGRDRRARAQAARKGSALAWLREAVEIPGVSGHEEALACWFAGVATQLGAEVRMNRLGSCVAERRGKGAPRGPRPRVLISAHADSIGLVVTHITPGGFLRVAPIGGVDARILPGQDVWVHGRQTLPGMFGSIPPHFQSGGPPKPFELDELFVDIGLAGPAARRAVSVGDLVSYRSPLTEMAGGRVYGRAMDNRASVVAALLALEQVARLNPAVDLLVAATTMEEVGRICVGGMTTAHIERPDYAITLDVTHGEMPGVEEPHAYKLGGGPALCVGPHIHPAMFKALVETAEREKIPYQVEPAPASTGTEVGDIQTAGEGIPSAVVSIPLRYMHSAVETLCLADLEKVARLLARFVVRLERGVTRGED